MLLSLFKSKRLKIHPLLNAPTLVVDVHAHVLPGLDDGADTLEESLSLIEGLVRQGVKKIIATPHVMGNYYRNTPELIQQKLMLVKMALRNNGIDVALEAAAEYYLDEMFVQQLERNDTLLSFGKLKYLLFETPFVNQPPELEEVIALINKQGYKPVLAHPERCLYLQKDPELTRQLHRKGLLFQLNINSLVGYYSRQTQVFAEWLVASNLIDFLASDAHRKSQVDLLESARKQPHFQQCFYHGVLNDTL